MNVTYNIWQHADQSLLIKHFLNLRFGDSNGDFIGELQMFIVSRDREEAQIVVRDLLKCLKENLHFKIIGSVEFLPILTSEFEKIKQLSIQTCFDCRQIGEIIFETFIGEFRREELVNFSMQTAITVRTGKGKAIIQKIDFIILKKDKQLLQQFGMLNVNTKRTYRQLGIDKINLLKSLPAANIRAHIRCGDTLTIDGKELPVVMEAFQKAEIPYRSFKYEIPGLNPIFEIVVERANQ